MASVWAKVVVGLALFSLFATAHAQQPELPEPPVLPTLSPPLPPRWVLFPEPSPLPSPPDAPLPDLGKLSGPPDKSKSVIKRALDRAMPNCLDAIAHICWSSPPRDRTTMSPEERELAEDMEIGSYAFKYKNYRGAELRFRDALKYKPGHPDATFKLAESLNKLGKNEEAKQAYQAYLESQPNGTYADRARGALERLSKVSASKN